MCGNLGRLALLAAAGTLVFSSCKDTYIYDDEEPSWLGSSIYGELQERGNFNTFLKIIEECGEARTLSLTGSKTLFVADDDAFVRFYNSDNEWGIKSYEDFTPTQKSLLLRFSMVNNAYLIETLSNYNDGGLKENSSMRRESSVSYRDTVPYLAPADIPNRKYWSNPERLSKGMYMWNDYTNWTMVYFLEKQLQSAFIEDSDIETILGVSRSSGDAHIFDKKVIERDITCKNGYLHILDNVLIPPGNMAQHINKDKNTTVFSRQMDRFSVPHYIESLNSEYKLTYPEFNDSIFAKYYFTNGAGGGTNFYPDRESIIDENLYLPFAPNWNMYKYNAVQADMAAMFVPTDEAMEAYFNLGSADENGGSKSAGALLMERFKYIDSIPDNIMVKLIKRHMIPSFISAVPSKFNKLMDTDNTDFPVTVDLLEKDQTYIATNGIVYHINKVLPPDVYSSVVAPVLFSDKTSIMNKAIEDLDFDLYLNSMAMEEGTEYSLLVPTDEYMANYIDPIAYETTDSRKISAALRFRIGKRAGSIVNQLCADVYSYNRETKQTGDSITTLYAGTDNLVNNRLEDILDSHIIVGKIREGGYYLTKGGQMVYVKADGENVQSIQGGGDIENNIEIKVIKEGAEEYAFTQANGRTYFIDKIIETPKKSVYTILSDKLGEYRAGNEKAFSMFFDLCEGFEETSLTDIFVSKAEHSGIDYNVKFFNTFNYTVFVPTNDAIYKAIEDGKIVPWDDMRLPSGKSVKGILSYIEDETPEEVTNKMIKKLERFIRYHFQDNSIFLEENNPISGMKTNQTATLKYSDSETDPSYHNTFTNKYYKLGVSSVSDNNGGYTLEITPDIKNATAHKAKVIKTWNGLKTHNILTRDYIFNTLPSSISNFTGSAFKSSMVSTSSVAVIHLIDNVLYFRDEMDCDLDYTVE